MEDNRDWQADMELCEKASPGPWTVDEDCNDEYEFRHVDGWKDTGDQWMILSEEDATFVAETRTALPYWLQQYAAEKERADKLEQQLAFTKEWAKATVAEAEALQDQAEAREQKLKELLNTIAYAPLVDFPRQELDRRRNAAASLLTSLYPLPERNEEV